MVLRDVSNGQTHGYGRRGTVRLLSIICDRSIHNTVHVSSGAWNIIVWMPRAAENGNCARVGFCRKDAVGEDVDSHFPFVTAQSIQASKFMYQITVLLSELTVFQCR
jgi:hypothetical protein